jgi:CubicO group peptidase (beta-lactamase class C family)
MANLDEVGHWLSENLSGLLAKYKVPGAAIGVYSGGQVIDFAAGVLSHATGVAATTDSVFQIGSVTKTWTGTLVMQLVDEGLLDIDQPVVRYLPEFDLADSAAAKTITVRQLLNHTAGFEGDIFTDTGTNDDCVEKYVATLAGDPQLFPPGEMFSYNNAGYCVLGRIVEVLRAKPYDQALRDHLFAPLGLTHAATDANSAILFRAAIGHLPNPEDPDGNPVPAPIYTFAKSNAPAGSALAMRPRDLLAFAAMHLNKGVAADGTRVLSADSVAAMQQVEVTLPPLGLMGDHWGLSWELFDLDGEESSSGGAVPWHGGLPAPHGAPRPRTARRVFGHDGGTIGQNAFLRIVPGTAGPGTGVAIALLTNGGHARDLYGDLYREIFAELAGVNMPAPIEPPARPAQADITPHLGRYERAGVVMEVLPGPVQAAAGEIDGPALRTTITGPLAELAPPDDLVHTYPLHAISQDLYVVREPEAQTWMPVTFYALATGERYLHFGARATPKVN